MGLFGDCCHSWKDFIWWCVVRLVMLAVVIIPVAFGFVHHVDVDNASLTRLALVSTPPTETTAFSYNLSLTLTIRNPNWAMCMTNARPPAAYSFDGQQFDRVRLADKGDAGKIRVYRHTTGSDGAALLSLGNAGVAKIRKKNAKIRKEKAKGVFDVEVAVRQG